jgi:predicted negative regulator of RcsB-dependent stress response
MQFGGGLGISDTTNGEGSPPTTNKYARRGGIVFIGGGAALVIGLSIFGGLAYFDTFHMSPPKPVAEKPTPPPVVQKPSPPAVAEKPTLVPPSVSRSDAAAAAPVELPAVSAAEPASAHAMADNLLKPPESQPKTQPSQQPVVTTDQTPPVVDDKELVDPAARELITRGWALYYLPYTPVRWQEARRDFEQAFEMDSRSSEARIGLASILSTKLADGWSPVLQEDMPRAEYLLVGAIDKGGISNRAAAHFALGVLRQMQTRLPEAQSEFETAISLDPNSARAYLHLAQTRLYLGEPEAAISPLEQAIRLRSDDPNIAITYWALGTCQLLLGRVDQAIDLLQTARAANARLWVPYLYLAGAYGLKGDLDKARSALAESIRLKPAIKSLARLRAENPWLSNSQYWALQEKTLNVGLRRAGFPDQ